MKAGWRLRDDGSWMRSHGQTNECVYVYHSPGLWYWWLARTNYIVRCKRTYKTAAGARAACERVARRLGVVA